MTQVKSKDRVVSHGEVFTNDSEIYDMLDLVKQETTRIDSRFLEPACGTGNFLVEILRRKLIVVRRSYRMIQIEYERNAIVAISSLYGIDLLLDNVEECRSRLLEIFKHQYIQLFKDSAKQDCLDSVEYILNRNIIHGDALTLSLVNNKVPIIFSEWSPISGNMIKRRDYTMANLMASQPLPEPNLFSDLGDQAFIPTPVAEYPLTHFLRLQNHD